MMNRHSSDQMTTKTKQHGGKRQGAGRPHSDARLVSFRISIPPEVHRWFVAEAGRRGMSVSHLYREAAEAYMKGAQ